MATVAPPKLNECTPRQGLKIPQAWRPGLENWNFGLAVFPWKKPVGHAFNKIKTQLFSSPCQRQRELLPSLGVRRPLTFHIWIFSSETPQPNELKLGRKRNCRVYQFILYLFTLIFNKFLNKDFCLHIPKNPGRFAPGRFTPESESIHNIKHVKKAC